MSHSSMVCYSTVNFATKESLSAHSLQQILLLRRELNTIFSLGNNTDQVIESDGPPNSVTVPWLVSASNDSYKVIGM